MPSTALAVAVVAALATALSRGVAAQDASSTPSPSAAPVSTGDAANLRDVAIAMGVLFGVASVIGFALMTWRWYEMRTSYLTLDDTFVVHQQSRPLFGEGAESPVHERTGLVKSMQQQYVEPDVAAASVYSAGGAAHSGGARKSGRNFSYV